MSAILLEFGVIVLLVVANAALAMAEIAVVSSRKVRLKQWGDDGDARARQALELAASPGNFLSTIQIGITLIGILAGAFGGTTIAEHISHRLAAVPVLAPYAPGIGLGIVVACITYLSLVIGELVPKRLALNNPERIACYVARPMQFMARLCHPIVRILSLSTEGVLRLLGSKPPAEPPITEAEIEVLVEEGKRAGIFHTAEQRMLTGVFQLDELPVGAIMTPRMELVWLDVRDSAETILQKIKAQPHARFPVADGSLDYVQGVVNTRDVLLNWLEHNRIDLKACLYKPLIVPESKTALELLEDFKKLRTYISLVMDEYGAVMGLLTINDLVGAVLGEMREAGEPARWEAVQREDGSWLVDAATPFSEFKRLFGISEPPEEKSGSYNTLGGLVLWHLQHIPAEAEHFEWAGLRIEVVDMDRHRIDKVLVERKSSSSPGHPNDTGRSGA